MNHREDGGAVVPLVTPVTAVGEVDEAALDRLVDSQLAGGVEGIFVLGTTGEGPSVPRAARLRLVERTVARVSKRSLVYAGIGDTCLADSVQAGNQYLRAGVDAVVAQPPVYFPVQPPELLAYFKALLAAVEGPLVIYNIPQTTRVSIPLEVLEKLLGHPRLVGFKDSENDEKRHEELIRSFGDAPNFAIFVGVGSLMAKGLKLGAKGIVPSAGNLIPETCHQLCASITRGDLADAERHADRMAGIATLYQKNRTLGQSLAALKAALHLKGICGPHMLPPLLPLSEAEMESLRSEMQSLKLLD
jgi:dihydrodipicolinate synthase/N-acetylneuraminate lyase